MCRRRAFTLIEILVVIAIMAILIAILVPALRSASDTAKVAISMSNLRNLGAAHVTYSADWSGRQWTVTPDDLSLIIARGEGRYQVTYPDGRSNPESVIPSVPLGYDRNGQWHETRRHIYTVPYFTPNGCRRGNYYLYHSRPFNQYINGKVFDPIFTAPKDTILEDQLDTYFEDPGDFVNGAHSIYSSSYALSPAALFNPRVYSVDPFIRRHPLRMPGGHRTPSLHQARYPDQKTHMIELFWLQNPPTSGRILGEKVPWLFNHGQDSSPGTLFFDGHVRLIMVREAMQSDEQVVSQGGEPLVIPADPWCAGDSLFFEDYAYNSEPVSSFHIYTTNGILGRDSVQ